MKFATFSNAATELLFLAGMRPVLADKLRYYADDEFKRRLESVPTFYGAR
jgi:type IV secretory pathway TraG/TraD family ATPase VirD4